MAAIKLKADLGPDLAQALREVLSYLSVEQAANRIWSDILSLAEQQQLGNECSALDMIQLRANSLGFSFERAMLDIAMEASVIDGGRHRRLRRQIGEPVEDTKDGPRPVWDAENGELFYRGKMIRKVSPQGTAIRPVLNAFEEDGWRRRIDNPLTGGAKSNKLRETVRTLNSGLKHIKFYADGTATGILWQEV